MHTHVHICTYINRKYIYTVLVMRCAGTVRDGHKTKFTLSKRRKYETRFTYKRVIRRLLITPKRLYDEPYSYLKLNYELSLYEKYFSFSLFLF